MQCHPDCTRDPVECRIKLVQGYAREPVQEWTLVYDGAGRAISQDPNTYVKEIKCDACQRFWRTETTAGKESVVSDG